ncbi:MAG: CBS domain-containing protein, partial [Actinomycetota bacterium]
MGLQTATGVVDRRTAVNWMLGDLAALERMLAEGRFDTGQAHIGAEQELFLVDGGWQPAPIALDVLAALDDPHFTTEIGAFNLEANLDPQPFRGPCLRDLHDQLGALLQQARRAANDLDHQIVLSGILPTIRIGDLDPANMVQNPRYLALNEALLRLRGEDLDLHITGADELRVRLSSVMSEACNASFQVHLQVTPDEFANLYNVAQLITGPTLACATNSPLLFGKQLWGETRIPLFEQSVDTRRSGHHLRQRSSRVTFGNRWVEDSVLELFKEDITRFRPLLAPDEHEDAFDVLARGDIPDLGAMRLHTGTVWRWNRACYGVMDGVPHLRIENRVLPSGPTGADEIANAALWLGLMRGLGDRHDAVNRLVEFDLTRANFANAAREGLSSSLFWLDGIERPAPQLLLDILLPIAADGLDSAGVDSVDRDQYLGIIERRVAAGRTGSRWQVASMQAMRQAGSIGQRLNSLTAAIVEQQRIGHPVAEWPDAAIETGGDWQHTLRSIEQIMVTELVTVAEDDPLDLAANLMEWHKIRHVLVEDADDGIVGILSYRGLLRIMADHEDHDRWEALSVGEVMRREPVCVKPSSSPLWALKIMRSFGIGALPVVD